ncbi:MAG: hypothetical protein ABGX04_00140 [Myxococcales bacterium]|nr:hypothetical protein [Myxococcales bacterium]
MNDLELRKQFLRIERGGGGVRLLVCEIHWDGPGNSVSAWVVDQHLPGTATDAEVNTAASGILEDNQYFRVCAECNERNPLGWMHEEQICQGCAVANHGIVY